MTSNPWNRKYLGKIERERREFIESLGPCIVCGSARDIEPHHTAPRDWQSRKVSRRRRLDLYKRDYSRGIIEPACSTCNKKLGKPGESNEPDPDFYDPDGEF